ncbi:MAG: 3-deoxy-D-manno-octulosonate 8-phosphate phosphatase, partial [Thermodesulfatator sp.]
MGHVHRDIVMSKASRIRLLVLDVDGVLTDGRIVYTSDGQQILYFHVHDGLGIKLLSDCGIKVAIISARKGPALEKRAADMLERAQ